MLSALAATRADYAALMARATVPMSRSQLRYISKLGNRAVSRYAVWYAAVEAFLSREGDGPERAARAKRVLAVVNRCALDGADAEKAALFKQMEFGLFHAARTYEWLGEMGQLTAPERERVESALIVCANGVLEFAAERGAMNRTPWAGLGPATMARLFPRRPEAKMWLEYAEKTWQDWWSFRDTFEDASGYNALWLVGVLLQAEQLGKIDLLREPAVERLFEYASEQFTARGMVNSPEQMVALVHACTWARDDLPAKAPALASAVTKRRDPYGRTLLDKLVLRAGHSYALVNLHDGGHHAHADGGAVSAFVAGGSVLLHELGYHQNEEQHHNTVLVRPADEPFLFGEEPFRPGRWYTSELDLRRPHTYTGGLVPDLERIASLFFRIDDRDETNVGFDFSVVRIEGIDGQGRSTAIVDPVMAGETDRWLGAAPSQTSLRTLDGQRRGGCFGQLPISARAPAC